jgi:hypothetical protein
MSDQSGVRAMLGLEERSCWNCKYEMSPESPHSKSCYLLENNLRKFGECSGFHTNNSRWEPRSPGVGAADGES